jgi:hypothetical protein
MKKERLCPKDCMEVRVRKGVKEQLKLLAARQNIGVEQVSEALVRRGLEAYVAERATDKKKRTNK